MKINPKKNFGESSQIKLMGWIGNKTLAENLPRFSAIIYENQRLGDFFLASKSISILLDYFGREKCALCVSPESLILAEDQFPKIPKIIIPLSLSFKGFNIIEAYSLKNKLRQQSCENLICLRHHRSPLSNFVLNCIPANYRWGIINHPWMSMHAKKSENELFSKTAEYPYPPQKGNPSQVEAHARILHLITKKKRNIKNLLPVLATRDVKQITDKKLVIAPWGSSNFKSLSKDLLLKILTQLKIKKKFKIQIITSPQDSQKGKRLYEFLNKKGGLEVQSFSPSRSIDDLQKQISSATAILCCDSFPAHLATAMDKPTAVLATGAMPGVFGPWNHSEKQRWFCKKIDCLGCGSGCNCSYSQPLCLYGISAKKVAKFLKKWLS